jgi:hypothetical protein
VHEQRQAYQKAFQCGLVDCMEFFVACFIFGAVQLLSGFVFLLVRDMEEDI